MSIVEQLVGEKYEIETLSNYDWKDQEAYLQIEEKVWSSDLGKLYIRNTSDMDVEYNRELLLLEGRFNPVCLATDEEVDIVKLTNTILGN